MSYTKHAWVTGETITAEKLNNIEDGVDDVTRQISDLEDTVSTTQIINTASGAIASFDDGADSMPIKKLVAQIEPVQDLHGYDHPWPAGGGVNLLFVNSRVSQTTAGVTYTSDDDFIYLNGTKNGQGYATLSMLTIALEPGTYYVRAFALGGTASKAVSVYGNDGTSDITGDLFGQERTFVVSTAMTLRFRVLISADGTVLTNYKIGIVISKTSGIDKFYPYSNECPISGWTGAEIEQRGKNLFEPLSDVNYKAESGHSFNEYNMTGFLAFLNTLPVGNYTVSFKFNVLETVSGATSWGILIRNSVTGYLDGRQTGQHNSGETLTFSKSITITAANKGQFANAYLYSGGGNAAKVYWYDFQLELGSTVTAYEPYTGNQISVTFPDEAGTVYGGTVDVLTWKLTAKFGLYDVTSLIQSYNNSVGGWGTVVLPDYVLQPYNPSFIAEQWRAHSWTGRADGDVVADNNKRLYFLTQDQVNRPAGKILLELATPIEYQLTPADLKTFLGTNNIWASTGDTEVTYHADTKLYVDNAITQAIANALNS